MKVLDQIDRWIADGEIVGFCPWHENDALLFGVIRAREGEEITVDEIDEFGKADGTQTYSLERITYFEIDPCYIERLRRLTVFQPVSRKTGPYRRKGVPEILKAVASTGEPVSLRVRSEGGHLTATVLWVEGEWVGLEVCDYVMVAEETRIVRLDAIIEARHGTAYEESDAYLMSLRR